MQKYELCVLFAGSQTEQEIEEHAKQVDELLKSSESDVKFTHSLGRKKLTYAISGQTHANYRCWLFEAEPESIPDLNEKLRLSQFSIRHLINKIESVSLEDHLKTLEDTKAGKSVSQQEEPEEEVKKEEEKAPEPAKPEPVDPKKEEKKVSLDQLDEKLDELLESDKL
ncbi:30S ribosomal protein S6 [bacterium]|jgi:ribosomal protein S6|nr:30S ribosomal protein S6 [bacterium]MDP6571409.1 30S ribosomal protein S6 [Patescibacteria group bacterium]|tara:strand:- start:16314 stop:16817 length:504 start_codon:yes stop_codon:yes gene_type:complete